MRCTCLTLGIGLLVLAGASPGAGAEELSHFFASRVVTYAPGPGSALFPDPLLALGGPTGLGSGGGSLDVVTLGVRGELVLGFPPGQGVCDADGCDFIVFENPFGTDDLRFVELLRVGVSTDGADYAFFPNWCGLTQPVGPYTHVDPSQFSGFAGVGRVYANVGPAPPEGEGNDLDPFDPDQAGGDAFDLADLAGHPLVLNGTVRLDRIFYVRLVDVLGDGSERDSLDNPVFDPTGNMQPPFSDATSADVDALSVRHGLAAPRAGDANRDGSVDGADYTIWADHYNSAPAIWDEGDFSADRTVDGADYTIWADHYGLPAGGVPVPAPPAWAWLLAAWAGLRRHPGRRPRGST